MHDHPSPVGTRVAFAFLVVCLVASCGETSDVVLGNTELNVIIPNGSPDLGPPGSGTTSALDPNGSSSPSGIDIQSVEYTINCLGTPLSFLDDPLDTLPNDGAVQINGNLEVVDGRTDAQGPIPPEFGTARPLDGAEMWQGFMDLPVGPCTIQLRARDGDGEVICTATESFSIQVDTTSKVNLVLICDVSFQAPVGMLDVDATFSFVVGNFCPDLFVINCNPQDENFTIINSPLDGQEISAGGCQTRYRDVDSTCGESCDPQCCEETPEGLACTQPGGPTLPGACGDPGPDPGVSATVTCASTTAAFPGIPVCVMDCDVNGVPDFVLASPTTPCPTLAECAVGDTCGVDAGGPGVNLCLHNQCDYTGDQLGMLGNFGTPAPLNPGPGAWVVAFTVCNQDLLDQTFGAFPLCQSALQFGNPIYPGAPCICEVWATDGDADCDKHKEVTLTGPGLSPCVSAGCSPGIDCAFCDDANSCTEDICDDSSGSPQCPNDPLAPGTSCPDHVPAGGACDGAGTCDIQGCNVDGDCDTDDCTFAPPGTCDLGSNLCGPLANEPAGTPCAGNTGQCDGGGACIDNCTGVDCSDGNQCTQDLCDSSGGVATCSNPNEIGGTLCDSGVGPGSGTCQSGTCIGPTPVRVETFNVALAGAFIPFEAERRDPLINAIPTTDADIICLQEVWEQADKDAIAAAAASEFPHSAVFAHDLDTPVDDPTDQNGQIPAMPSGVPCPDANVGDFGANLADQLDQTAQCLADFCSTTGDETGRTTSAACAANACTLSVAGLLLGNDLQQRCYACAVTQLPTEVIATLVDRCKTIENQDVAFRGQNGVMILSRFPLSNEETFVVPGTWNRRVVVNATATLPTGAELDVYCNHLTPIFNVTGINTFPYTGQYGGGATTEPEQWAAEQQLQAEKLITYVQQTSVTRPAVVLGDINAGREVTDAGGQIVLYAEGEPTLDVLESALTLGATASYEPLCTFCDTNPLNGVEDTLPVWIDHIYLYGLDASTVVSTERTFDEFVVPVQIDDGMGGTTGALVPLSDHYGMRSVIVVP
jgi:exonuclease III